MHPWMIRNMAQQRVADMYRECARRSGPPSPRPPASVCTTGRLSKWIGRHLLAPVPRPARRRRPRRAGTGALGALR